MERITRVRAMILTAIFLIIAVLFAFKLYDLQIIETGGKKDNQSTFVTRTRVKAARGDILDSNGNMMVSNRASYDLVINHYVLLSATGTNNHIYRLIQACQAGGYEYSDHLPISRERPFTYTLDQYNAAWQGYFQKYLAKINLDSDITAPLLIQKLRAQYKLPEEWSEEEARLVIGIRYEMALRGIVASLPNYIFMEDADDESLAAVVELNVPGLTAEASTVREYNTKYAAHILGYVGAMNAEQWEKYKDIEGYSMDTQIGQSGLEAAYEQYLHGTDGIREDTVARDGTLISSRYITEPKAGSNVEISIDLNLQMVAEDKLLETFEAMRAGDIRDGKDVEGGAVVAMNVKTGQLLVSASYPSYDLATMSENWDEIVEDPLKPLYNRALQAAYPPGSTYKPSMVIAGINSGVINSGTQIYDAGVYRKYAPFTPSCLYWTNYHASHGTITASDALKVSCNYFFYELGDRLSINAIDKTARELGLGEPTGVELSEELGHRANEQTKAMLYKGDDAKFYAGDRILTAIGQSDNRFTPIQLCSYTMALANQGVRYKATFMNRVVSADYRTLLAENNPQVLSTCNISEDAILAYTKGMCAVAGEQGGTAYSTFRDYPIQVAAKTGTAETFKGASDNAAFILYAPADDPQIAIAIYGEKAGHGSSLAAIARTITDVYFDVDEIGDVVTYENKLS